MSTTSSNTKSKDTQKINKGPFAKFVNRRNARNKVTAPAPKAKAPTSTIKK